MGSISGAFCVLFEDELEKIKGLCKSKKSIITLEFLLFCFSIGLLVLLGNCISTSDGMFSTIDLTVGRVDEWNKAEPSKTLNILYGFCTYLLLLDLLKS